jgi:hypothetical protein
MTRRLSFLVPSPAVAVAFAALLAACGGVAVAATSSSPVIRACANKRTGALRLANRCRRSERRVSWNQTGPQGTAGVRGARGATGATGAAGAAGTAGAQGNPGPTTDVLPSGKTERGWFLADTNAAKGEFLGTSITFNFALPSAPEVSYVDIKGAPTANCPGSLSNPQAAPGKLCLYVGLRTNVDNTAPYTFGIDAISSNEEDNTADPFGAQIYGKAVAEGRAEYHGTYAVTAK